MARKASAFSLSRIVSTRRENLAAARRELNTLQLHAASVRAALHVVNMVADYANDIGFTQWSSVTTCTYSTPELHVNLEGTVSSLKQGAIVDIIDRAMACGFEPVGTSDYLNDWASQRTFKFIHGIAGVVVELKVIANIAEASAACRKVQVGTELKEVAKYEIVCS